MSAVRPSPSATCILVLALAGCGGTGGESVAPDEAGLSRLELIGKRVFFDTSLSNPAGQSCGSCHDPQTGFSGNFGSEAGVPFAADRATLGLRNTPTAAYARFAPGFTLTSVGSRQVARGGQFLDGRAASLEEQAGVPFFSAGEMNLAAPAELAARMSASSYATLVREEFGEAVFQSPVLALRAATTAIAAFERSARFAPFSSRFDRWLRGEATLTAPETEGFALFIDPAGGNCSACHTVDPASPDDAGRLFTDFGYYNLGVPRNPRIPANADPAFFDLGLCGPRRETVADQRLCGAFKVPTLRNVARRQAFMHNGVFTTLREAVAFHARRDAFVADLPIAYQGNVEAVVVPLALDDRQIDTITAFLATLDD